MVNPVLNTPPFEVSVGLIQLVLKASTAKKGNLVTEDLPKLLWTFLSYRILD